MSSELAGALEEVINREANSKLRKEIEQVFGDFQTALAELCHSYDAEVAQPGIRGTAAGGQAAGIRGGERASAPKGGGAVHSPGYFGGLTDH